MIRTRVKPSRIWLVGLIPLGFLLVIGYFLLRPSLPAPPNADWLAEKGSITLAAPQDQPPLGFYDQNGEYRGLHRDLADGLAFVLGIELRLIPSTTQEALLALEQGEVDGVLGVAADPRLGPDLSFSTPYLESRLSIFVLSENPTLTSLAEFSGQAVAMEGEIAEEMAATYGVTPVIVADAQEGLQKLLAGEAVAYVGDERLGLYALSQLGSPASGIRLVGGPLQRRNYAIAVENAEPELLTSLNYGLTSLGEMGLLSDMERGWLGSSPISAVPLAADLGPSPAFVLLLLLLLAGGGGLLVWNRSLQRGLSGERKRARDFQDKLRKVMDTTSDAVVTMNPMDGSLLEANRQVELLTGYGKADLLQMDLGRLLSLKDRRRAMEGLQNVLLFGSGGIEDLTLVRKDGTSLSVEMRAQIVSVDGRRVVQCLLRDVTEKKEMRRELLERNRDLATINAIATLVSRFVDLEEVLKPVLSQVLDMMSMEAGSIFLVEEGKYRLLLQQGLEAEGEEKSGELISQVLQSGEIILLSDLASDAQWEGMAARRGAFGSLAVVPLKSKAQILGILTLYGRAVRHFTSEDKELLESIGNQIGVAVENSRLFSELERTVGALTAAQNFNESILQSMTDGLLVVDTLGRATLANRGVERMLGYEAGELFGKSVEDILGTSGLVVRESLEREVVMAPREVVLPRKGGGQIPVEIHLSPLPREGGDRGGVVVVVRDLSAAKAMEEERRRLDRLALLGEMSAVVAHEIRNPLAGIGAGVQHLLNKVGPGDTERESLEMIQKETERVNRIIEEILIISRPVRLNLAPCNLVEVLEEVLAGLEPRFKASGVRARKYYAPGAPQIKADAMRLNQAFTNLISNALEAMGKGGELRVVVAEEDQGELEIEIRDNGNGIKKEDLPRIFEPFYTTKPGGTGLGLAIVKRIIEEHGGRISVASEEGKGTTFTVRLQMKK